MLTRSHFGLIGEIFVYSYKDGGIEINIVKFIHLFDIHA